jgi:hypothetical protein
MSRELSAYTPDLWMISGLAGESWDSKINVFALGASNVSSIVLKKRTITA